MKRVISKVKSTKNIFTNPGKRLKDISFATIDRYFILTFIVLFILSALSFWAGFIENHIFFQIAFFFFIVLAIAIAIVFYRIRKGISYLAQRFDSGVKKVLEKRNNHIIDIDVEE